MNLIDRLQTLTKKHMADLLFVAVFAVVVPLFIVNKPEIHYNNRATLPFVPSPQGRGDLKTPISQGKGQLKIPSPLAGEGEGEGYVGDAAREYKYIEGHNIFAPTGSYDSDKHKNPAALPPNPYHLVAVFMSGVKKAVFSVYTGEMVALKEGDELLDGSVIKAIGPTSVTLQQGKARREMKILTIEKTKDKNETHRTRRNPPV